MKRFLLLLLLSLIMYACSRSYIDVRYSEPVIEKNEFSGDDLDILSLRNSFVQPLELEFLE